MFLSEGRDCHTTNKVTIRIYVSSRAGSRAISFYASGNYPGTSWQFQGLQALVMSIASTRKRRMEPLEEG